MVEIFKTDVSRKSKANTIIFLLQKEFPDLKINFDLKDCDNVLRVEGKSIYIEKIISLLNQQNHLCELLQ